MDALDLNVEQRVGIERDAGCRLEPVDEPAFAPRFRQEFLPKRASFGHRVELFDDGQVAADPATPIELVIKVRQIGVGQVQQALASRRWSCC